MTEENKTVNHIYFIDALRSGGIRTAPVPECQLSPHKYHCLVISQPIDDLSIQAHFLPTCLKVTPHYFI